jgi:hypothetical protein
MNVPVRPKVVTPGPKLQMQTPVKLSGPKVVRVEAPEVIAPRVRVEPHRRCPWRYNLARPAPAGRGFRAAGRVPLDR